MNSKSINEAPLKGQEPDAPNPGATDKSITGKKTAVKDTDTEPDEFIGHDADTDQPVDRQIMNDAVLRGEKPFDTSDVDNTGNKEQGPKKMDAGKL
jgi:hypothetical protein